MELRQLKYFAGVADELHFGRAARRLFVSQPALSQQIKLLERELGVELFVASKRNRHHKVELTEAGASFLTDAKRILQLSDQAVRNVRQAESNQLVVTLGVFKLILPERIMGMLELFSTHFPSIDVRLVEAPNPIQVQDLVASDQTDLGLCVLPLERDGLTATQYAEADYAILMETGHPLARQKAVRLSELQHEKWIDHGPDTGLYFDQLEEACRQANFHRQRNIAHFVPSFDLLKSMVRLGKGIAFIPATLDLRQEPNLKAMPIVNLDGTPFKQVVIRHVLIHRAEQPKPLVLALSGIVRATSVWALPHSDEKTD
ncbi:LysR family transcriptional regulator [Larkinella terrae]|uniref:LysR family transcriptional regulator n=1 Tax=Larkinella terrae TaxID=2025311 RepID=A0A7K0EJS8_9BACT|nr:LysR substrate-binding domain-containing protein [Larkinella terrae]MRS62089.1 LysR family transcriptional regulator [Larkinella terrae]